jgi:AAA+ superfamily predicted ATPase
MTRRCRNRDLRRISVPISAMASIAGSKNSAGLITRAAIISDPSANRRMLRARQRAQGAGGSLYRVDLNTVVSKYIGETERNLHTLFEKAENKEWILFVDEADALFSKRTDVRDAHDRYANVETALEKIVNERGVAILIGTALSHAQLAASGVKMTPRFRKWPP